MYISFYILSLLHQLGYIYKICKIVKLFPSVYLDILTFSSAPSRHVLVYFKWYGHPKK